MATGMSQEQIGALMAQANLSPSDRSYSLRMQEWMERAGNSPQAESLTRRQQNLAEIGAFAQARAHNVDMTKAYLRAGGRETSMLAQVKDQLTEQKERAQLQFWVSMYPLLERMRQIFSDIVRPGGGIETFGDVMAFLADKFARALTIATGATITFAGAVASGVNIPATGLNVMAEMFKGDPMAALGALKGGLNRQGTFGNMAVGGMDILMKAMAQGSYNPEMIDRLMGMDENPGRPYQQVIVQGVPIDELLSKGYRVGEQTGRVFPVTNTVPAYGRPTP